MPYSLQDLASLAQLHLLQEFRLEAWVVTDPDTHLFFKKYAEEKRKSSQTKERELPKLPEKPPVVSRPIATKPKAPSLTPEPKKTPPIPVDLEKSQAPSPKPDSFADLRKMFSEKFPNQQILDTPPCDKEAKKIGESWKWDQQIKGAVILVCDESPEHLSFLEKVAKAIETHFCPASVIPASSFVSPKGWHLILGSPTVLSQIAFEKERVLITLEPLENYLKDPRLKGDLWKRIKDVF